LVLALLVVSLLTLPMLCARTGNLPKDAEMIAHFEKFRTEFDELQTMCRAEPRACYSIERTASDIPSTTSHQIPKDRQPRFEELMRKVELKEVGVCSNCAVVWYPVKKISSLSWTEKGYAHSISNLSPLTESLDGYKFDRTLNWQPRLYRRIGENWYLYLDYVGFLDW
jgi:hypothetical protein